MKNIPARGQIMSKSSWVGKSLASSRIWETSWLQGRECKRKVVGSEVDRWAACAGPCGVLVFILKATRTCWKGPKQGGSLHFNKVDLRTLRIWVQSRKFWAWSLTPKKASMDIIKITDAWECPGSVKVTLGVWIRWPQELALDINANSEPTLALPQLVWEPLS